MWLEHHFQGQKAKGQGHHAALPTAALTCVAGAAVGNCCCVASYRRHSRRYGAHGEERGGGILCCHAHRLFIFINGKKPVAAEMRMFSVVCGVWNFVYILHDRAREIYNPLWWSCCSIRVWLACLWSQRPNVAGPVESVVSDPTKLNRVFDSLWRSRTLLTLYCVVSGPWLHVVATLATMRTRAWCCGCQGCGLVPAPALKE